MPLLVKVLNDGYNEMMYLNFPPWRISITSLTPSITPWGWLASCPGRNSGDSGTGNTPLTISTRFSLVIELDSNLICGVCAAGRCLAWTRWGWGSRRGSARTPWPSEGARGAWRAPWRGPDPGPPAPRHSPMRRTPSPTSWTSILQVRWSLFAMYL